ncbi:MAG: 30S ribosomal protein S12 methylthiotransferase RimO [Geodermatophilaceae bacterium]
MPPPALPRRVALLTLGCARNDVDSEELAGRLTGQGWMLVADGEPADAVVVNTCGFVDSAKKDSIDTVLAAADSGAKVVAVGCLAERYGAELAAELPEAAAVLGFDHYPDLGARLDEVVAGHAVGSHVPTDRRRLLPLSPTARSSAGLSVPGHAADEPPADLPPGIAPASGPRVLRRRLSGGPMAPLKLASGCDRRCTFCAIPSFRGAFVSRRPADVLAEASWLAGEGVREVVLVSENSTSYGKDLGDLRLLETLLPELAAVPGIERVRVSYLQPAELRPGLIAAIGSTPGVAPYFDLSFQHAAEPVLRRMRRFGSRERFVGLLDRIRAVAPEAGARSNVIVGFPGETEADLGELEQFLIEAGLDAVGVFGYSDEDGTEAATLQGKLRPEEIRDRVERVSALAESLTAQRAEDRIGSLVEVLVEDVAPDGQAEGRAAHQAPEVDGTTTLPAGHGARVGEFVRARVTGSEGVDLLAAPVAVAAAASRGGTDRGTVPG